MRGCGTVTPVPTACQQLSSTDGCTPASQSESRCKPNSPVNPSVDQPPKPNRSGPSVCGHEASISGKSSCPPKRASQRIQKFVTRFTKNLGALQELVHTEAPSKARLKRYLSEIDVRVADVAAVDGHQGDVNIDKLFQLRRGLSMLSLASEYDSWTTKGTGKTATSMGRRKQNQSSLKQTYLDENKYRFGSYDRTVVHSIRWGRALMKCDRNTQESGYLAILILRFNDFKNIRVGEHKEFTKALRSHNEIKTFAECAKLWIDQWRREYGGVELVGSRPQSAFEGNCADVTNNCTSDDPQESQHLLAFNIFSANIGNNYTSNVSQGIQPLSASEGNCADIFSADIGNNYTSNVSQGIQPLSASEGNCADIFSADIGNNYTSNVSQQGSYADITNNYTCDGSQGTQPPSVFYTGTTDDYTSNGSHETQPPSVFAYGWAVSHGAQTQSASDGNRADIMMFSMDGNNVQGDTFTSE
ncbi:MAG: hypothetical protein Q9178_006473 [Gyalolechia marmorata]